MLIFLASSLPVIPSEWAFHLPFESEYIAPLDGTNWRRLVNMRLRRTVHDQQEPDEHSGRDFWVKLHSFDGPMFNRESCRRAVYHWFLIGQAYSEPITPSDFPVHYTATLLHALSRESTYVNLDEVEHEWENEVQKIPQFDPNDPFWIGADAARAPHLKLITQRKAS